MNGERARELRRLRLETLNDVQPALQKSLGYTRTLEVRLAGLKAAHESWLKDLNVIVVAHNDDLHAHISRGFWGRFKWLLTGK